MKNENMANIFEIIMGEYINYIYLFVFFIKNIIRAKLTLNEIFFVLLN